jgi:hypothetical protein
VSHLGFLWPEAEPLLLSDCDDDEEEVEEEEGEEEVLH